jgi:hypothetical protein
MLKALDVTAPGTWRRNANVRPSWFDWPYPLLPPTGPQAAVWGWPVSVFWENRYNPYWKGLVCGRVEREAVQPSPTSDSDLEICRVPGTRKNRLLNSHQSCAGQIVYMPDPHGPIVVGGG